MKIVQIECEFIDATLCCASSNAAPSFSPSCPARAAVQGEAVQCALASARLAQGTLHLENVQKDKPMSRVSARVGDN